MPNPGELPPEVEQQQTQRPQPTKAMRPMRFPPTISGRARIEGGITAQEYSAKRGDFAYRVGLRAVALANGQQPPQAPAEGARVGDHINRTGTYVRQDRGDTPGYIAAGNIARSKQVDGHRGTPLAAVYEPGDMKASKDFLNYMKTFPEAGADLPVKQRDGLFSKVVQRKLETVKGYHIGYQEVTPQEPLVPVYLCADETLRVYSAPPADDKGKKPVSEPLYNDANGRPASVHVGTIVERDGQSGFQPDTLGGRLEDLATQAHYARTPPQQR